MTEYQKVLQNIIDRELFIHIAILVGIIVLMAILWIMVLLYWKKVKGKSQKRFDRRKKERHKAFLALGIFSTVMILGGVFAVVLCCNSADKIKTDIEEQSYETYEGEFYVLGKSYIGRRSYRLRRYDTDRTIDLANGESVILYINDNELWERWRTESGKYSGRLVYGEHSKYVVEMELSE